MFILPGYYFMRFFSKLAGEKGIEAESDTHPGMDVLNRGVIKPKAILKCLDLFPFGVSIHIDREKRNRVYLFGCFRCFHLFEDGFQVRWR